ncbi:CHAT domain-containing protein [Nostoc sp. CENA67]|uniref:CHAT domain-containing protein n=1 Tax=Amazonocrinis nigriterrae CENA67 TaxID=2794033 RepID=A0A8J7L7Z1_9NOST|nr:CHAT domain-containing protein [Amazonocrinis nigriterrae]MBH8562823.1 CHAT domain-containing protein [Amazonocrinis nigriterrae CENA67]
MHYGRISLVSLVGLVAIVSASACNFYLPFQQERVLAQTTSGRKTQADRLLQLGIQQLDARQFQGALVYFQQALIIYQEIKDRKGEAWTLGFLGSVYSDLENYASAVAYYKQSLVIAREINDSILEGLSQKYLAIAEAQIEKNPQKAKADQLLQQGNEQVNTSQFEAALQSFQKALIIFQNIKDRKGELYVLGNIGNVYHSLSNYPKAIEYHQRSLAIAREIKNQQSEGYALSNLGIAYHSQGNYLKAIDYYEKLLVIARQIKDRKGESAALNNLGIAYSDLGNYLKAIDYYKQSLQIAEEIQELKLGGGLLVNLGLAYYYLGNYPQALEYYQQALIIAREIKDREQEAVALGNLGLVYDSLGDYPKAIDYHQQRLVISRNIKDRYAEGQTLDNIGIVYRNLGNYLKAIEYYQQALTIAKEIGDRQGEASALGNLGNAYLLLGNYPKGIDYQEKRLVIAREIKDRQSEANGLGSLGSAYFYMGDYQKSLDYSEKFLAITREIKDREGESQALNNLGAFYYKSGNLIVAEKYLSASVTVLESLRDKKLDDTHKISIFETQKNTYETLQKVLIAQNKTAAALEIAERSRARAFVELFLSHLSSTAIEKNIYDQAPQISQIKQIAKTQNTTIVQYSIISDAFEVTDQQKTKESELYIWVIKPTGEVTFRKADMKPLWQKQNTSLKELITTTRTSLGIDDKSRSLFDVKIVNPQDEKVQKQSLQTLHKLLIQPIADLLPTDPNQRVVFVPQGDLFLVPFPALLDEKDKYLIEKHTILTSPSIQVLELTRQQRNKVKQSSVSEALVVGNPTMPNFAAKIDEKPQKLATLPGAKREAEAIAPILNTKALTGDAATETAIKAKLPQAKIIHLATHGLFDDFQGLQSAIALAPSKQDDGLLTAEEILDLKLNADLVVLSACNTGRGRITGDGVIGLSRSLFIAGTPSVIVSLWSVPDSPTAELMTEFYTNLNQNKLDKAQALRQAMLKIKQQYPNKPLNWAAFTLIGEAE